MKIHFAASTHKDAEQRYDILTRLYGQHDLDDADYIVPLGGDGHMLHILHSTMDRGLPVFGMNCGRLGFLMNHYASAELPERLAMAESATLHPLRMQATDSNGDQHEALAINEVSLIRQTHNAAHISVDIDDKRQLDHLVCDGVLLATPAGSTAYNLSAHGPIIPLGAELMALTPISPFRPRRWRGALLADKSSVTLTILNPDFRPVSVSADSSEFRDIQAVNIAQASDITLNLLYDPGYSLSDRAIAEQFIT